MWSEAFVGVIGRARVIVPMSALAAIIVVLEANHVFLLFYLDGLSGCDRGCV